ncbi:MAG: transposase, partial [Methylobacteriaceae bacterium]|nr:transposase [Methylobacteriaceae bacterium]
GRGYLPHFDSPETVQHVVFRTADRLPDALMQGLPNDVARRRTIIDTALDRSTGGDVLRLPEAAAMAEHAIRYFDGARYRLLAWCVMPNHVHVVLEQTPGWSLGQVVRSWKLFTTRELNQLQGTSGPVWASDYFDRYMRDEDHLQQTVGYVENNPVKAALVETPERWPFSSARFSAA